MSGFENTINTSTLNLWTDSSVHKQLSTNVTFLQYAPTQEDYIFTELPACYDETNLCRLFIGQLPHICTPLYIKWIVRIFCGNVPIYRIDMIRNIKNVFMNCAYIICSTSDAQHIIATMQYKILTDINGAWYPRTINETNFLSYYLSFLSTLRFSLNVPIKLLVVELSTSRRNRYCL